MSILRRSLSFNAKRALLKGFVVGVNVTIAYLTIVVVTTPNLPAATAIATAFTINPLIIVGVALGVGAQVAMTSYGRTLGCSLKGRKGFMSAGSGGTAFSSLLSFFSLVPLGCCGSWLLILSLLPSVFGTTVFGALIQYSIPLSYAGLAIVVGFTSLTAIKLRKELRRRDKTISQFKEGNKQSLSSSNFSPDHSQPNRKRTIVVVALSAIAAGVLIFMAFLALNGTSFLGIDSTQSQIAPYSGQNDDEGTKQIVPLDQIVSGGPPRDGIPSIDKPKFTSSEEASSNFLQGSDLVIGLEINGDVRAYPLKILVWHEIVNDDVGGTPVAITYCPLCFTSQVFNRTVDGQVVEFGTSGKLYNSNLVLYDRTSESLWSQAIAKGIVGKHAGKDLERIPFDVTAWNEWKKLHPESKVLSTDTGFGRPYGVDPYGSYYTEPNILFPVSHKDDRLGPKEIVIGLEDNGNHKAYLISDIENIKVLNDAIGNKQIALVSLEPFMVRVFDRSIQLESSDSQVTTLQFEYESSSNLLVDKVTGTKWNFDGKAVEGGMNGKSLTRLPLDEGFWFSWVAFHPDTEVYMENENN